MLSLQTKLSDVCMLLTKIKILGLDLMTLLYPRTNKTHACIQFRESILCSSSCLFRNT